MTNVEDGEKHPLLEKSVSGNSGTHSHSVTGKHGRKRLISRFSVSECELDSNEEEIIQFHGSKRVQYFAALAANMGALSLGTVLSWSAVALPGLRDDPDFGNVTDAEESWIGSIITLGSVVAGPAAGFTIDAFGRRKTMLLLSIPFLLGWFLIYFANSILMIYAGRLITGFCGGVFCIAAPIFTAEMADVEIRGLLCAGFDMMISVGILFIFGIGMFAHWRLQALICASLPLVMFFMLLVVPESPRFLIRKGRVAEAAEALIKFRGAYVKEQVEPEIQMLKESANLHDGENHKVSWRDIFNGPTLRPISIAFCIYFFQVASGIDPVLFYTVDICKSANTSIDEYTSTLLIGAIQVVSAGAGAVVVDRFGRRPLLMISEICMVVSLGAFGTYFYLVENASGDTANLSWLPLTCLIVYVVAYSVGVGPVGYMIMGEILPQHVKGLAACVLTSAKWGMSFGATKFFYDFIFLLGEDGTYWMFAACSLLGFFYIFTCVPETKGKTLDEIQLYFAYDSDTSRNGRRGGYNSIQNSELPPLAELC